MGQRVRRERLDVLRSREVPPLVAARACAARMRAMEPRGETPKETAGCSRVASTILTAYSSTSS